MPRHATHWVIASDNQGKLLEFSRMLQPLNITVASRASLQTGMDQVEETAQTFVENSLIKARHCTSYTSHPVLADDSGLCVPALANAPGIYSARYSGERTNSESNIELLLHNMRELTGTQRRAFFYCCLILLRGKEDPVPLICEASWWGSIAIEQSGDHGFGYDPIFIPDDCNGRSAAQLQGEEKNAKSHRGQAVHLLLKKCTRNWVSSQN